MTAFPKTMPAVVIEIALTAVAAALVALRIDVAPTKPASVGAAQIELLQRHQHVDEVVPADHALRCGGNLLDLAGAAGGKGAAGIGGEAARLLDAVAEHEGAGPDESVLIINDLRR
jgi:hypothetical protein